jgi:hypothetical protein
MAGFSTIGKNTMLNALPAAPYVSLHSSDPGDTGAAEIAGGAPAYARQTGALATSTTSARSLTVASTHNVPASTTVAYVGLWSAASGGTFYGSFSVTSETYGGQGTYQVDSSNLSLT